MSGAPLRLLTPPQTWVLGSLVAGIATYAYRLLEVRALGSMALRAGPVLRTVQHPIFSMLLSRTTWCRLRRTPLGRPAAACAAWR